MSVTRDDVLRIAQLVELEVDEESLPTLLEEMSRILDYVAQLNAATGNNGQKAFVPGPDAIRFRADEENPWPLALRPNELAAAFNLKGGFFVVPKLDQFE